jgi:hypothetical protein
MIASRTMSRQSSEGPQQAFAILSRSTGIGMCLTIKWRSPEAVLGFAAGPSISRQGVVRGWHCREPAREVARASEWAPTTSALSPSLPSLQLEHGRCAPNKIVPSGLAKGSIKRARLRLSRPTLGLGGFGRTTAFAHHGLDAKDLIGVVKAKRYICYDPVLRPASQPKNVKPFCSWLQHPRSGRTAARFRSAKAR